MLKQVFRGFLFLISFPFLIWSHSNSFHSLSLIEIEKELTQLKQQLHNDYIEEMKDEVESQNFMIADWDKYSHEVQKIKIKEEEVKRIKEQIQELEKLKAQLLEKQNQQMN